MHVIVHIKFAVHALYLPVGMRDGPTGRRAWGDQHCALHEVDLGRISGCMLAHVMPAVAVSM